MEGSVYHGQNFWVAQVIFWRQTVDERVETAITIRTAESIRKVQEFVSNDRNAALRMMVEILNINKETIRQILKKNLSKAKGPS